MQQKSIFEYTIAVLYFRGKAFIGKVFTDKTTRLYKGGVPHDKSNTLTKVR